MSDFFPLKRGLFLILAPASLVCFACGPTRGIELRVEMTGKLSQAWRDAAADLGIRVTAPFQYRAPDGTTYESVALVHGFGSAVGTVVASTDDVWEELFAATSQTGHYASALNPENYLPYERENYIETLDDWGWYGVGPPPAWYTGVNRNS